MCSNFSNNLTGFQKSELIDGKLLQEKVDEAITVIKNIQRESFNVNGKLIILPPNKDVLIVGDLHGDLETFKKILKLTNFYNKVKQQEDLILICLGDYIDRGPNQVELMQLLLSLLICYPNNIILLRGNHEGPRDIGVIPHDFPDELKHKIGDNWEKVYCSFLVLFNELYTACLIEEKALLVHGGIPVDVTSLDEIAFAHDTHPQESTLREILWNDPSRNSGSQPSFRGMGKLFGEDIANEFLKNIGVSMLIRGHKNFNNGYYFHGKIILTVFSCILPIYKNKNAAYLFMPKDEDYTKETLSKNISQV